MKKILNKIKINIKNKNGASNLEMIIAMVVAIVIGASLIRFSGNVRNVVDSGSSKVNEIGNNL